jgi:hypothetical protein
VDCGDTNKPARLARVTLEPVDDLRAISLDARGNIVPRRVPTMTVTETGMDGSYLFDRVAPGQYYIVAELPGYLSPLEEFTTEEIRLPTEATEQRFSEVLQHLTVVTGRTARMDFRLERGGAIEGKIVYDDGSPVTGLAVAVLRKDEHLGWRPVTDVSLSRFQRPPTTDDRGRYRISMLPPGEYTVAVELEAMQGLSMMASGDPAFSAEMILRQPSWATRIYLGDVTGRANAKVVSLRGGEEHSEANITIPMRKLHTVSGTVVATRDGHPVDRAHVLLEDSTDGSTVKETWVSFSAGKFTFSFVPEGDYLMKVMNAADGAVDTVQTESGQVTESHFVPRHVYADTEQPLQVGGDIDKVSVKVPEPAGHRP